MQDLLNRLGPLQTDLGPLVAAVITGLLLLLLRRSDRRKLFGPLALFLAFVFVALVRAYVLEPPALARALQFLATALLGATIGLGLLTLVLDAILARRRTGAVPKIFRDIGSSIVWFVVGLAVLREGGVEPGSLLTTSALLTAVIGLSLQDTLGNVFSGLSIQAQQPFEVGDWLQLSDSSEPLGKVTEINWRATKLLSNDQFEIIVPNGVMAKASIRNFSRPTKLLRRQILVQAPYSYSPEHIKEVILACVVDTPCTVAVPAASVSIQAFSSDGVTYVLRYWLDNPGEVYPADSNIRERIWYGFRRAGIPIPLPQREVRMHQVHDATEAELHAERLRRRVQDLRGVDLLDAFPDERVQQLAERLFTRRFAPGETVLRKGDSGEELFIIEHGEVAVLVPGGADGAQIEVARLAKGKFFGEMSLMTGERRAATIRATQDCALLVVNKTSFREILAEAPEVAEKISAILAARQAALAARQSGAAKADAKHDVNAASGVLLARIREFFALG
ncbi:MAG: mechanosensitive ion channel [Myxococcales bacterium]|nr:mechanosensitive ion channel [Myxococcales bacterium]